MEQNHGAKNDLASVLKHIKQQSRLRGAVVRASGAMI
jgi:hypothetical protein